MIGMRMFYLQEWCWRIWAFSQEFGHEVLWSGKVPGVGGLVIGLAEAGARWSIGLLSMKLY